MLVSASCASLIGSRENEKSLRRADKNSRGHRGRPADTSDCISNSPWNSNEWADANSSSSGPVRTQRTRSASVKPWPHAVRRGAAVLRVSLLGLAVASLFLSAVSAQGPTISIDSPRSGEMLTSPILVISGTSTNASRVELCMIGIRCQNATGVSKWSVSFDLSAQPEGAYTFEACAYDPANMSQCVRISLTLTRTGSRVLTVFETYVLPGAVAIGVLGVGAMLVAPRSFRAGSSIGSAIGLVALTTIALRILFAGFSWSLGIVGALFVSLLIIHRVGTVGRTRRVKQS